MKRDWDLVRKILATVDVQTACEPLVGLRYPGEYDDATVAEHVQILVEAGLLVGSTSNLVGGGSPRAIVERLTWAGHDFLDLAQDDTIWHQTKERVLKTSATISFDLLVELLKSAARSVFGL